MDNKEDIFSTKFELQAKPNTSDLWDTQSVAEPPQQGPEKPAAHDDLEKILTAQSQIRLHNKDLQDKLKDVQGLYETRILELVRTHTKQLENQNAAAQALHQKIYKVEQDLTTTREDLKVTKNQILTTLNSKLETFGKQIENLQTSVEVKLQNAQSSSQAQWNALDKDLAITKENLAAAKDHFALELHSKSDFLTKSIQDIDLKTDQKIKDIEKESKEKLDARTETLGKNVHDLEAKVDQKIENYQSNSQNKIDSLSKDLNAAREQFQANDNKIKNILAAKTEAMENELKDFRLKVNQLNEKRDKDLQLKLEELSNDQTVKLTDARHNLALQLENGNKKSQELQGKLRSLEQELETGRLQNHTITDKLKGALDTKLDTVDKLMAGLQNKIAEIGEQKTKELLLKSEEIKNEQEAGLKELQHGHAAQQDAWNAKSLALEARMETLEQELTFTKEQLHAAENKLRGLLNSRAETSDKEIAELESKLSDLLRSLENNTKQEKA